MFNEFFFFVWEVISNIWHSISSQDETPRSLSKILCCVSYFQLSSQCLIMWWNTASHVWYITSRTIFITHPLACKSSLLCSQTRTVLNWSRFKFSCSSPSELHKKEGFNKIDSDCLSLDLSNWSTWCMTLWITELVTKDLFSFNRRWPPPVTWQCLTNWILDTHVITSWQSLW